MDDGELMDEFPRGVAQLRSGVDGNDGGRLGRQRRDQSDSRHLDLFFFNITNGDARVTYTYLKK